MPSTKGKKSNKSKLLKIDVSSSADSDESEHELSYYAKDKVKLMKEVLKLIKPKKIKSMAPECIKDLDTVEINSMLLEELLGISNKRLQYIFNGENVDRETSSSESEEEKQPIDVISLDDISDDDDIEFCISEQEKTSLETAKKGMTHNSQDKSFKIKTESVEATIKTGKSKKDNKKKSKKSNDAEKELPSLKGNDKDKLMSVLELLELQARARAIRSQLAIENEKKTSSESEPNRLIKVEEGSDSDAIIVETPEHKEIVITSSDSEEDRKDILLDEAGPSNNIQHSSTDATPPSKMKKSEFLQNQETTECFNKNEDVVQSNKETENAENSNKQNENVDSDNNIKKQRLLAKIQKIKLVRNRSKNAKKNVPDNSNKCVDNVIDPSSVCKISTEKDCSGITTSISTDEKQVHDVIESSAMEGEDKNDLTVSEKGYKLECEVKEDKARTSNETTTTKKSANTSYCDNDEIVINLDENEMDGIE